MEAREWLARITRGETSGWIPEHARLLEMGATHLLYCKGLRETNRYADTWPDGLAALLNRDDVPAWLEPVDGHTETKGAVRLYRIRSN